MNDYISELTGQLKIKRNHIIDMEKLLHQQEIQLDNRDYEGFGQICHKVDRIVAELKNIDYEIAVLESSNTSDNHLNPYEDQKIADIISQMKEKAEENKALLNKLAGRLIESRITLRKELDNTVAMGRISGYRPFENNSPVYYDKRN
ncbi:MAG: hypothetical protein V3W18_14850 [candidate division Zixibacteria bacterium]